MNMLSCKLDRQSKSPLYEQLYFHIKNEIICGRLLYQEKLPSKRKLAEYLQISQNTVETAYEQLTAEGYIEVKPRKGYFVMAYEDLEYVPERQNQVINMPKDTASFKYHFHPSHIDTSSFPFKQWRKLAKHVMDEAKRDLLLLGDPHGEIELRNEISSYLYHARGVVCKPDQIIVGAGIEVLLQQLILLFDRDTKYGVEDPGYHLLKSLLTNFPNQVFPLEVDEDGLRVEAVEDAELNVVYATPSHHFPYGTVLPINRRAQLLHWAMSAPDRYIIEDDYDSEFRYSGKAIPSLQSMDQSGRVIYLGSFSKSLMPSIRISYMVLPNELLRRYEETLSYYHSTVSRLDQHILAEFMKSGDFERHLNRMRKIYRRKLEIVTELLKPYAEQISVIGEKSGLHLVLVIDNGLSEQQLVERAAEQKVKVYTLSDYTIVKNDRSPVTVVLGFAGIDEEALKPAVEILLNSWGIL